jgi:endoglucanase
MLGSVKKIEKRIVYIMDEKSLRFLKKLMSTRSPAGFEFESRKVWKDELNEYADRIDADYHGNLCAILNEEAKPRILLAGHLDEIGFMVRFIDDDGFIYFRTIGGVDTSIIQSRKVIIKTGNGDIIGVIGRKAIHLMESDEHGKAPSIDNMFIDIGAKDGKEAKDLIEIGDPITYDNGLEELRNNIYTSRAFDDKAGAFISAEVLKNLYQRKSELKASVWASGTCQEEAHTRGSSSLTHRIKPDIGIAIDMTFSLDTPHSNTKKHGGVKLGKGPALARGANTNPKLLQIMIDICKEKDIPYQLEAEPAGNGTDADPMQTISGGATALLSVPIRYMHTQYEVLNMSDVDNSIKLLTELCLRIDEGTDFIP